MHFEDHIWEKPGYDPTYKDDDGEFMGRANMFPYSVYNTSGNSTLNYIKDLGENHHINWLVGTEYQYNRIKLDSVVLVLRSNQPVNVVVFTQIFDVIQR